LLSHRDVEELLAERGIQVSYEAIASGVGSSGHCRPVSFDDVNPDVATNGTWTKWRSRSTNIATGYGVPSTRMGPFWTS
jgi:transposase-like protein